MKIFIDSSVLIAGLISSSGGSAKILEFCEVEIFQGFISSYVIQEVHNVIRKKIPKIEKKFDKLLAASKLQIVKNTKKATLQQAKKWIRDPNDVAILAAAKDIQADFLITLDVRHFILDKNVAEKSKIKIVMPGDFLANLDTYLF